MTTEEIQAEINGLKNLLCQTDYEILKSLESLFSATSATGYISALKELAETLSELRTNRQSWRDRINELEATEAEDPEPVTEEAAAPEEASE